MSQDLVKSAARALEILEVFASERKRMNSAQLGTALGYPKSSLSVLLKSLVAQGYLANGNGDQDYFPTLKLARLGEWIPAALLGSDALLPMLAKLRDQTGETVTLTMATDLHMRCLHALIGTHPISLQVEDGVSLPMVGTAIGTMYLATRDDKYVSELLSRWAKQHPGQSKATMIKLRADIAEARAHKVACAYDIVLPDTGAVAMPITPSDGSEALIVAVAGLNHRIHQKETSIIQAMRMLIGSLS
jgi:DNA-binding IclR family transcriptional regulator